LIAESDDEDSDKASKDGLVAAMRALGMVDSEQKIIIERPF